MPSYLKHAIVSCKILGFWPLKFKNKIITFLYNCYFGLTITITLIFVFGLFMELPEAKLRGLKDFSCVFAIGCQFSFGLIKLWGCLLSSTKHLILKIQVTEKNIFKNRNGKVKRLFAKSVNKISRINILMMWMVLIVDVLFSICPWLLQITNSSDNFQPKLPLDSWVPIDRNKYYKTLYGWSILGGFCNSFYIVACDNVYFCLITFVTSQLEILQLEITQGIDTKNFDNWEIEENLRKIILYHNNIVKFVKDLNGIMKYPMLLGYALCVVHSAIVIFEVATESLSFQLLRNIYYLGSVVTEQFLFYWLANEIYTENLKVIDAMWNCDWYNCSNQVKKSLILMMMRVKRPLRLMVGPFYYMTLDTMIMIFKSSLSYAIALVKFYDLKN